MQVLVDMGNTRTKYCCYESESFGATEKVLNTELNSEWMTHHWRCASMVVFASVADDMFRQKVEAWCVLNDIEFVNVETGSQYFGVTNGYQNYRQLGVDRWLALLGTKRLFEEQTCIIVDAGTATTVDVIDAQGMHQGGWILAGIDTLVDSIQIKTAKVSGEKLSLAELSFGKNTSENLAQAAWAATLGLVNKAIALVQARGVKVDRIIVTGGNAEMLMQLSEQKYAYEPQLVFHGLATYI